MSNTDIQNSEAKKALDYVESQRLDNLQRSVKPIFQPQDPIELGRDIAYEFTIPEKKKLLMRMYDLYEAGKKQNQKAYYDLRSEILELVYLIQDDTARCIQQETEKRVREDERNECAKQILCQQDIDGDVCDCCRANYARVDDVDMRVTTPNHE